MGPQPGWHIRWGRSWFKSVEVVIWELCVERGAIDAVQDVDVTPIGCAKLPSRSCIIPTRSITALDATLSGSVTATISVVPLSNMKAIEARAPQLHTLTPVIGMEPPTDLDRRCKRRGVRVPGGADDSDELPRLA